MKLPKRKESDILSSCLKLLKARGIWAMRLNTGGMKVGNRYVKFGISGQADILALRKSYLYGSNCPPWFKPHWIECKSSTGKQSPAQRLFANMVNADGHIYSVVHSAEELNTVLG